MAQIEARPTLYMDSNYWFPHTFHSVEGIVDFIIGRNRNNWGLYINGRSYAWPKEADSRNVFINCSGNFYLLTEHIRQCVELDEAFYGTD